MRAAESIAARRAAASAAADCRASESPAITMLRVAESIAPTLAHTLARPAVPRCGVRIITALRSAGFTAGRRMYVRAQDSGVLISPRTTPTGIPLGYTPPSPEL